jgi:hypothetical protein
MGAPPARQQQRSATRTARRDRQPFGFESTVTAGTDDLITLLDAERIGCETSVNFMRDRKIERTSLRPVERCAGLTFGLRSDLSAGASLAFGLASDLNLGVNAKSKLREKRELAIDESR